MTGLDALMVTAVQRDGLGITPCHGKKFSDYCYTEGPNGELQFWYNTPDGNTQMVSDLGPASPASSRGD